MDDVDLVVWYGPTNLQEEFDENVFGPDGSSLYTITTRNEIRREKREIRLHKRNLRARFQIQRSLCCVLEEREWIFKKNRYGGKREAHLVNNETWSSRHSFPSHQIAVGHLGMAISVKNTQPVNKQRKREREREMEQQSEN